jgi:hypothetical protein
MPPAVCDEICTFAEACLIDPGNCPAACGVGTGNGCSALHQAYLECVVAIGGGAPCVTPAFSCQQELFDFLSCRDASPIGGGSCGGGNNQCFCTSWDEKSHFYDTDCFAVGPGGGSCDCYKDGELIGSCDHDGAGECDAYSNCCAPLIFGTSPP